MATNTGPLTEAILTNKRPSWDDIIHNINESGEVKNPFLALLKSDKEPVQMVSNWAADDLDGGGYGGKLDNEPAGQAKNKTAGSLSNASEWNEEVWKVSKLAGVTDEYGVPRKQSVTRQKKAALNRLLNGQEKLFLSEQDAAMASGETPYRCRGIGKILASTGHASAFPIAENLAVPASCIFSGALDTFDEDDLEGMLSAASTLLEEPVTYDAFVGPLLKRRMDIFAARDPNASATNVALRTFNQDASAKEFLSMVDVFKFSVGMVRTHISFHLFCAADGSRDATLSAGGGYFLDMRRYRIAFNQSIKHLDLPKDNSGVSGVYDYIATLKYGVPKGQCMVRPSSLES
jgi:hypothetical protein